MKAKIESLVAQNEAKNGPKGTYCDYIALEVCIEITQYQYLYVE